MSIKAEQSKHQSEPGPPCRHMEGMLNRAADGSARGFTRWYALAHAARCGRCNRFLHALEEMLMRLRRGKEDPPKDVIERLAEKVTRLRE